MSTYEALALVFLSGTMFVSLIGVIVSIIALSKDKNK